jgi:methylated-DNA-[protein]-cysteine S-methyltransferase
MDNSVTAYIKTPIGFARITGTDLGISEITVVDEIGDQPESVPDCIAEAQVQLEEYFLKKRTEFDLKLQLRGTDFQKRVWEFLIKIPYGKTMSYMEQAHCLGDKKAIRAVASANGKNPIWIVIPCHRVIGSDGALTGYAGGVWRKNWLLQHESAVAQLQLFP